MFILTTFSKKIPQTPFKKYVKITSQLRKSFTIEKIRTRIWTLESSLDFFNKPSLNATFSFSSQNLKSRRVYYRDSFDQPKGVRLCAENKFKP